ncbi:hypothetical protein [Streptomyces sp. NPDC012510]|uniref:hypothetical protein n=1 Tax=Streptomyces sp. NPDC012510 TaxID=3364838 RepID=UPI0036E2F409
MDFTASDTEETLDPKPRRRRPDLAERNRAGHEHPIFPHGEDAGIKHCTKCCTDKPLEEFPHDRSVAGARRANCKPCASSEVRKYYHESGGREKQHARRKALIAERYTKLDALKDVPCADCGGRFPRVCMDFDHVRGEKIESISRMIRMSYSWENILAEIAKCEVVCSNCHRIRTADRGQWYGAAEIEEAV